MEGDFFYTERESSAYRVSSLMAGNNNSTNNSTSTAPTPMEIAQYQFGVWTFITLAIVLTSFAVSTCNMSFDRDKFTRELFREERQAI